MSLEKLNVFLTSQEPIKTIDGMTFDEMLMNLITKFNLCVDTVNEVVSQNDAMKSDIQEAIDICNSKIVVINSMANALESAKNAANNAATACASVTSLASTTNQQLVSKIAEATSLLTQITAALQTIDGYGTRLTAAETAINAAVARVEEYTSTDILEFVGDKLVDYIQDGTIASMINAGTMTEKGDFSGTGNYNLGSNAHATVFNSTDTSIVNVAYIRNILRKYYTVNVKAFGAIGDGNTDDSAAIENAIAWTNTNKYGFGIIFFPVGKYRITRTINIQSMMQLEGETSLSRVSEWTTAIVADSAVETAIHISPDGGNGQSAIKNLCIIHNTTSFTSSSRGVLVDGCNYVRFENVTIARFGTPLRCYQSVGNTFDKCIFYGATSSYVELDSCIQTTFIECNFGRNGAEEGITGANKIVHIVNIGDTYNFIRCQFNPTVSGIQNGIYFNNTSGPNGIYNFIGCHSENVVCFIGSTSGVDIKRLCISDCTIHTDIFISSEAGATFTECKISNNNIAGITTIINGGSGLIFSNNNMLASMQVNIPRILINGNDFHSTLTLHGNCTGICATNIISGGLTNNSAGGVNANLNL